MSRARTSRGPAVRAILRATSNECGTVIVKFAHDAESTEGHPSRLSEMRNIRHGTAGVDLPRGHHDALMVLYALRTPMAGERFERRVNILRTAEPRSPSTFGTAAT